MPMTTRSASHNEEVSRVLRHSPRNFPHHLKEKSEQPKSEREPNIENLSPIIFKGSIRYTNNFFGCAEICDKLIQEVKHSEKDIIPVGFDLEWPFSYQTGSGKTALAQICLEDSICYLLYVYSLKKLPVAFIEFLCHPKVRLVGVNIKNDVWKLGRDFKEFPARKVVENNCLDCGTYANQVLKRSCRWSLKKLTAYLLKKKISKDPEVRNSKWHIQPLSEAQKSYAATDAYDANNNVCFPFNDTSRRKHHSIFIPYSLNNKDRVSLLLHTTIQTKAAILEKQG